VSRMVSQRGQSARVPHFGHPGPPFLPNVGDVYLVAPLLYSSSDPKPLRPVVVIEVPARPDARIRIVTRTSKLDKPGVRHGVALQLGLDRAGVWSTLQSVERSMWCPQSVRWKGPLETVVFEEVLERFL
jgi:hypothetical protein